MSFTLIFKPLAEAEVAEAFAWYSQPDIGMGAEFLDELERIERSSASTPFSIPPSMTACDAPACDASRTRCST